jgi:hypothetical protein
VLPSQSLALQDRDRSFGEGRVRKLARCGPEVSAIAMRTAVRTSRQIRKTKPQIVSRWKSSLTPFNHCSIGTQPANSMSARSSVVSASRVRATGATRLPGPDHSFSGSSVQRDDDDDLSSPSHLKSMLYKNVWVRGASFFSRRFKMAAQTGTKRSLDSSSMANSMAKYRRDRRFALRTGRSRLPRPQNRRLQAFSRAVCVRKTSGS